MAKSGGPTVGLDIGARNIKVAELTPGRNGVTVRALGIAPTPPGAMENNIIVDAKVLGDAIKKLLKEAGVSSKRSVSSVSGQGALVVRVIEVPKMSDTELAETMRWEVERHVPFAANEVIMDFQPIQRPDVDPEAANMEVLLAVAQQEMIDSHVKMLFAAGLSPSCIDVEPLAASRCLIELGPDPYSQRTVAIVNIGASNTDIGIFRNGILSFPRTLPMGGDTMTNAIMAAMGVDEAQAEDLKLQYGEVLLGQQPVAPPAIQDDGFFDFGSAPAAEERGPLEMPAPAQVPAPVSYGDTDPTKAQVFGAIAPILQDLVSELNRSLEYYRGRNADSAVDEILVCGGSARLKNLDQFLASELGVPCRIADAFQHAGVAAKNFSGDYVQNLSPSFAVAVGLAARDMVAVPVQSNGKRGKK